VAELGGADALELELRTVDMSVGEHKQAAFLQVGKGALVCCTFCAEQAFQVNPFGKLPALSDGVTHVFESGACLLYLHDRFEAQLYDGRPDAIAARARASAWVLFANSTLGNGLYLQHMQEREAPGLLGGLEALLARQPFLEKDGFSVADVAVGGLLLYLPMMVPHLSLDPFPAVRAYCARLAKRKAYSSTLGARLAGAADGSAPPAPPTRGGLPVR